MRAARLAGRLVAFGYRLLLLALPRDFRRAHGRQMRDLFDELLQDAARHSGLPGVTRLAGRALVQVPAVALAERRPRRACSTVPRPQPGGSATMMDTLLQDFRFALRSFRQRPAFSLATLLLVALGIGATTTIYSVVDAVLLTGLPYPQSERLVWFDHGSHSAPSYLDWLDSIPAFETLAATRIEQVDLSSAGPPARVTTASVTANLLPLLGAVPDRGRLFLDGDVRDHAAVALLDYDLWQQRWGGDPAVIGTSIRLDGRDHEVVGVLARGFEPPAPVAQGGVGVWLPLDPEDAALQHRGFHVLDVIGRLDPQAELPAAQQQIDTWLARMADEEPDFFRRRDGSPITLPLRSLHEATVGDVRDRLWLLLGAVSAMLLIACVNVANLFLARSADREREMAVRTALGASRARIAFQLLTESLLLSLAGGVLGVALAAAGLRALRVFSPADVPRLESVAIDPGVLLFALGLSLLTGLAFGSAPALYAARARAHDLARRASRHATATRGRMRLKSGLVVVEIGLALVLLMGAGLLFGSFVRLHEVDPGFAREGMLVVPLGLRGAYDEHPERRLDFARRLAERLTAVPGVTAATAATTVPFSFGPRCCWSMSAESEGIVGAEPARVLIHPVGGDYFRTLGVALDAGRAIGWSDSGREANVAVISRPVARSLFPGLDPVGRELLMQDGRTLTVVGVIPDLKHWSLSADQDTDIYVPYGLMTRMPILAAAVRFEGEPGLIAEAIRQTVWQLDPNLPVPEVATMASRIRSTTASTEFLSTLLVTFAALALALAAAGIYATTLYSVSQRRREFGIRLAVGASRAQVVAQVLRGATLLTAIGIVLGIAGGLALSRFLEGLLFGVSTTDTRTMLIVTMVLVAVSLAASVLPARRAGQTDPVVTLRAD